MEFFQKYLGELIFGLISAGCLGFCKHLLSQNKKLKQVQQENQTRIYRQMIVDEIEPLVVELHKIKSDMDTLDQKHKESLLLILESYKFRFIQLCKIHLRDGHMTQDEFDQVTEMYKVYHGLGGNGLAEDYYHRVLQLDIK